MLQPSLLYIVQFYHLKVLINQRTMLYISLDVSKNFNVLFLPNLLLYKRIIIVKYSYRTNQEIDKLLDNSKIC